MFQPTARDTMYPITTNRTGYSNTTVLRRNGNAVGLKRIALLDKHITKPELIRVFSLILSALRKKKLKT